MKVWKSIGAIIGLVIIVQILLAVFLPAGLSAVTQFVNIALIIAMLLGVFSLLLGGKFSVAKPISKTGGLFVGLLILSIVLVVMTGSEGDAVKGFMEAIPFGSLAYAIFSGDTSALTPVGFARGTAILFMQLIINPITTGLVYEFIFSEGKEVRESKKAYALRSYNMFMNPPKDWLSFRGVTANFFGAAYAVFISAVLFIGITSFLANILGVAEIVVAIILFVVIVGLLLFAWLFKPLLRGEALYKLGFGLIKMIFVNILIVFIVGMFVGNL